MIWVLCLSSNLLIPSSPQKISHRGQSLNESLGIKWFWIEEVPRHYFVQNHSWWLSANDMKRDSISICLILKVLTGCLWVSWEWSTFCFLSAWMDMKKRPFRQKKSFQFVFLQKCGKKDPSLWDPVQIIPNPQTNSYQFSRGDTS